MGKHHRGSFVDFIAGFVAVVGLVGGGLALASVVFYW